MLPNRKTAWTRRSLRRRTKNMAVHLIADDIIRTAGARALEFCANAGINLKEIAIQDLVMAPFINVIIQFTERQQHKIRAAAAFARRIG
jgi:hypothetical protein